LRFGGRHDAGLRVGEAAVAQPEKAVVLPRPTAAAIAAAAAAVAAAAIAVARPRPALGGDRWRAARERQPADDADERGAGGTSYDGSHELPPGLAQVGPADGRPRGRVQPGLYVSAAQALEKRIAPAPHAGGLLSPAGPAGRR